MRFRWTGALALLVGLAGSVVAQIPSANQPQLGGPASSIDRVRIGDTAASVRSVVGEPRIVRPRTELDRSHSADPREEVWTYKLGLVDQRSIHITLREGVVRLVRFDACPRCQKERLQLEPLFSKEAPAQTPRLPNPNVSELTIANTVGQLATYLSSGADPPVTCSYYFNVGAGDGRTHFMYVEIQSAAGVGIAASRARSGFVLRAGFDGELEDPPVEMERGFHSAKDRPSVKQECVRILRSNLPVHYLEVGRALPEEAE